MSEQISQAIGQSAGTNLREIRLGPAYLPGITVMPKQNYLFGFPTAPFIQDIEAIEDEIDLKDALKSLKEPGSISLADFKKKLGI
jgi:hypothetical protein